MQGTFTLLERLKISWETSPTNSVTLDRRLKQEFAEGRISLHFDLDGSFGDWPVGEHYAIEHDAELEGIFNTLHDESQGKISVITGRPHVFIENLFPNRRFLTYTEFGAVDSSPHLKEPLVRVPFTAEQIERLSALLKLRMDEADCEGCNIELGKMAAITIEMTGAKDLNRSASEVLAVMRGVVAEFGEIPPEHLAVNDGWTPKVPCVDIISPLSNKGRALEDMMKHPSFFGTKPVYFGDSGSDRPAMEYALRQGGYAVGIGPNAPRFVNGKAERCLYFDNVDLARDFLRDIVSSNKAHKPVPVTIEVSKSIQDGP